MGVRAARLLVEYPLQVDVPNVLELQPPDGRADIAVILFAVGGEALGGQTGRGLVQLHPLVKPGVDRHIAARRRLAPA